MTKKSITMEKMELNGENVYVDLNDILDILNTAKKGFYTIIFDTGEVWYNIKLKKAVINKFNKTKEKRGQI